MQEDTSADVTTTIDDADIPDVPLIDTPATAQADPTSAETTNATQEAASTEETTDQTDAEANDTEATEQSTENAQTEEPTKGQPDPVKAHQAYMERQRTRQMVANQLDQVYGPRTQEQIYEEALEQGIDPNQAALQAQVQALQEQMVYSEQRGAIAELNATMQAEAVNAMNDFPVFNEKSPEFDPDFTAMVEQQYRVASRLQADQNGIILNAEVPLYDFYKSMADIYSRGSSRGAKQAQAETVETLSRVESVAGGSSTTARHEETLEEMGERLANLPLI